MNEKRYEVCTCICATDAKAEIDLLRAMLAWVRVDIDAAIIFFEQKTGERAHGLRQTQEKINALLSEALAQ